MLIVCEECGKEYSDRASACPNCACPTPVKTQQKQDYSSNNCAKSYYNESDYVEYDDKEVDKSVEAAQVKLDVLSRTDEKIVEKLKKPCFYIALVWTIFCLIFCRTYYPYLLAIPFWVLWFMTKVKELSNKDKRRRLEMAISGKKVTNICPYCSSDKITFDKVVTGSKTYGGKTTISKNINPLRPFTYANVNHGNTTTVDTYGTLYQCMNCGKTFKFPQKIWL